MKVFGLIPARYGSKRFPGKPLAEIHGKPMIQHVCEQAKKCERLSGIMVATDDDRIRDAVHAFGGECVMTLDTQTSGTDRCAEVLEQLPSDIAAVVNIQGDEPGIHPDQINQVAQLLVDGASIASLAKPIAKAKELLDQNRVKVVMNASNKAMYFSRTPIPYFKGKPATEWVERHQYYKHIGIYGYSRAALRSISHLERSALENAESLEQLRWLENGYEIQMGITKFESPSIDTPQDLENLLKTHRES